MFYIYETVNYEVFSMSYDEPNLSTPILAITDTELLDRSETTVIFVSLIPNYFVCYDKTQESMQ